MFSIAKITSAQAKSYYKKEYTKGDYYSKKGNSQCEGEWLGKGSAKYGLSGDVNKVEFENLLDGKSPDGNEQLIKLTYRNKTHQARAAFDMGFSVPKSVSLAALVGGHGG